MNRSTNRDTFLASSPTERSATAIELVKLHGNIIQAANASGIDRRHIARALKAAGIQLIPGQHAAITIKHHESAQDASQAPIGVNGIQTPPPAPEPAKDDIDPSTEAFLRSEITRLNRENRQALRSVGADSEAVSAIRESVTAIQPVPLEILPADSSKSTVDMVIHLTDWHYGQVQPADETEGFGEYSPEIAHSRVSLLASLLRDKATLTARAYNIRDIHLLCTGDFISGDIHRELSVTNAMPAPQQAVGAGYLLAEFVVAMRALPCETVKVHYLTLDNHSRLTRKPQSAQGGINSWGLIVSEIAHSRLRSYPGIEYNQYTTPTMLVTVGSESYLCLHGHQIRGWMGKPYYGFDRRAALEAMRRLNQPEKSFTCMVLGHFHAAALGDNWTLGGSLSGTTAFDHGCGRHAEPHQTSWLVHPEHGEFDFTRWWLGSRSATE